MAITEGSDIVANGPGLQRLQILAEILRLQRWAGGESVSADRVFGLMHGFETVIREESEGFGITEETQDKVEDLLEDVESGKQSSERSCTPSLLPPSHVLESL